MSKVSRLKERPAWCSRQAGIVKAQDPRAGQLVAVQAHSLGSRGAAGSRARLAKFLTLIYTGLQEDRFSKIL